MRVTPADTITKVRRVWRRAPRRWRQAVMVALAIALPGSITAGATAGMLSVGAELNGMLPVQEDAALDGFLDPELLEAVPVGASSVAEPVRAVLSSEEVIETLGESDIPSVAVDAYMQAADELAVDDPTCGIRWTLLAAIGRVESNHGRFGGAQLRDDGYGTKPIRGIPLDGRLNVALIRDTDGGELDGDTTFDRAVGPMQFIPPTWQSVGVDADGDGRRDPNNIFDAALGAAVYLCRGDADLRDRDGRAQAVRRYNNADEYVRVVLDLAEMYASGDVDFLPSIGLPPRAPTPRPRPTPAPPVTAPDPETPLTPSRPAAPVPDQPDVTDGPAPPPATTTSPQPSPTTPQPTPATPQPSTPPSTPAPAAPTTTTTVPDQPPVTTPDDTVPPTTSTTEPDEPPADAPDEPVTSEPDPGGVDEPAEPPAAVGWAPAMREVVVEIIEEAPAAPTTPTPPAAEPEDAPPGVPADAPPAEAGDAPPAESGDAPPAECPPAGGAEAAPAEASPGCPPSPAPGAPPG
jgi:Transglycosylase SLT domain